MADTIELLEIIGRDASLRHASAEELTKVLEQSQASEALTAAVASNDRMRLSEELGHKQMEPPQSTQGPWHEEEEQEEDDGDEPHQPPAPDRDKPSPQR
ncbi:MAG: hypothetical protein ABI227_08400 [Rhodanobacter sp.]